MEKIRKSKVIFTLEFTTSKLLSYVVLISSSLLGYLLNSNDIAVIGLIVSAALSGVKNITESLVKLKSGVASKVGSLLSSDGEKEKEKNKDEDLSEKEKQIL
jgi:hypothetical protein